MAIQKVIEIVAETKQALKDIKELYNEQLDLQKDAIKSQDKLNDEVAELGDAAKESKKGLDTIKKGVSGVGLAFKALGIGLIISAFNTFKDVLFSNQEIADGFATVMNTVNIIFNKTVGVLIEASKSAYEVTGGFDALGKVLGGLLTLGLAPLKLAFFQIKQAILASQLVWEKSFFGDGDEDTIKRLNEDLKETSESITQVGKDVLKAGGDIINNFSEAVSEVGTLSNGVVNGLKEVSLSASFEQAKSITQNKKNFELLALQQTRIREQADRDAETQRKYRDDFTKDIDSRIEANSRLSEILIKQEQAEKSTVKARINALLQEQKLLGTKQEITNELFALETELIAIEAQQAGFKTEQDQNAINLLKEKQELNNSINDADKDRRLEQLEFEESQQETEALKLEKQREQLTLENELILEDIERKRELYALGTQARVDAENEYKTKSQEINNAILDNAKKSDEEKEQSAKALEDAKIGLASSGLGILSGLAKKGSALAKGVAVSQAIISTYQGVNKALAETTDVTPTQTLRFANAAAVGIAGALNVAKILSTNESGDVSGGGVSATASAPAAPSFNVVQGTGTNQIAEGLQGSNEPIKAFVVSSDVTTSQSLDRNIIDDASI